jgi:hypothetical protein
VVKKKENGEGVRVPPGPIKKGKIPFSGEGPGENERFQVPPRFCIFFCKTPIDFHGFMGWKALSGADRDASNRKFCILYTLASSFIFSPLLALLTE